MIRDNSQQMRVQIEHRTELDANLRCDFQIYNRGFSDPLYCVCLDYGSFFSIFSFKKNLSYLSRTVDSQVYCKCIVLHQAKDDLEVTEAINSLRSLARLSPKFFEAYGVTSKQNANSVQKIIAIQVVRKSKPSHSHLSLLACLGDHEDYYWGNLSTNFYNF